MLQLLHLLIPLVFPPSAEYPLGGSLVGHFGETSGAARRGKPRELQGVCQCRALLQSRGSHHPSGHPWELHQDHKWTSYWHARQPAQGSGQHQPGNPTQRCVVILGYNPPKQLVSGRKKLKFLKNPLIDKTEEEQKYKFCNSPCFYRAF